MIINKIQNFVNDANEAMTAQKEIPGIFMLLGMTLNVGAPVKLLNPTTMLWEEARSVKDWLSISRTTLLVNDTVLHGKSGIKPTQLGMCCLVVTFFGKEGAHEFPIVVVNNKTVMELTQEQLISLFYHEIGHIELHLDILQDNSKAGKIMLLRSLGVIPQCEYEADEYAAKHTSKEAVISWLKVLSKFVTGVSKRELNLRIKRLKQTS